MKFIDLFAGLGGFHKSLHELGHECVFVSEIDPVLARLYEDNWKIKPHGDIRKLIKDDISVVPPHNILCAGFPCQPFSKAGKQMGREDKVRGTLFDDIIKILEYRKPDYFILENVPFLANHNNEATWKLMRSRLENLGYEVDHENYSPHEFGIPQHRVRIFIVGAKRGLKHFSFEKINAQMNPPVKLEDFLEENPAEVKLVSKANSECLDIWQGLINSIPKKVSMPGFPIWAMEFGATYPYDRIPPDRLTSKQLSRYKGNFGISLKGMTKAQQMENLPSYARTSRKFPMWKQKWILQNRKFYKDNKQHIDKYVRKLAKLNSQSWQKLEWNVGQSERVIRNYILQFRASGIRVKKANVFPSLVLPSTQIPIIGWKNRYITKNEGLKLQSLDGIRLPPNGSAFSALGNAVNSKIVKVIAKELVGESYKNGSIIKKPSLAHEVA